MRVTLADLKLPEIRRPAEGTYSCKKEYDRQYHLLNKERRYIMNQSPERRDRHAARTRKWYKNPENMLKHKSYRRKNRDLVLLWKAKYRERHKEKVLLRRREYTIKNREKVNTVNAARRKKLKIDPIYKSQIEAIYKSAMLPIPKICFWCKDVVLNVHVDHKTPISRGGKHVPENLCLSCIPCNLKKGNKMPEQWENELCRG